MVRVGLVPEDRLAATPRRPLPQEGGGQRPRGPSPREGCALAQARSSALGSGPREVPRHLASKPQSSTHVSPGDPAASPLPRSCPQGVVPSLRGARAPPRRGVRSGGRGTRTLGLTALLRKSDSFRSPKSRKLDPGNSLSAGKGSKTASIAAGPGDPLAWASLTPGRRRARPRAPA